MLIGYEAAPLAVASLPRLAAERAPVLMPTVTRKELRAVLVAWNELTTYIDTIGTEADLDDEEMPQTVLRDAANDLRRLLIRHGLLDQAGVIV